MSKKMPTLHDMQLNPQLQKHLQRRDSRVAYERATMSDYILDYLQQHGGTQTKVIWGAVTSTKFEYDYAHFCHLCEIMESDGMVELHKLSGVGGEGVQEYQVKITNKGIAFINYGGGYLGKWRKEQWLFRDDRRKARQLFFNSIAVILASLAPLAYQMIRDANEKKKVVKLELSSGDIKRLKALLEAAPKIELRRDSAVHKIKKLPKG